MAGRGSKGSEGSKGKKRPPARRPAAGPGGAAPKGVEPPGTGTPATKGAAGASGGAANTAATKAPAKGKPTQAERLEAARRARRRKAVLTRAGIAGAIALLVLIVAVAVINDKQDARAEQRRLTAGSCTYDTKADRLTVNNHTPPASYEVDPPAGGDHSTSAASAVFFEGEGQSPPPDAQLVHSLEHGFVVISYRPDLPEQDVAALRKVFDDHSDDVIVVPRPSLKGKVAMTSWGRRLLCGDVEPQRLSDFVELYRNKSPEPNTR